jgi:hypothetical protein
MLSPYRRVETHGKDCHVKILGKYILNMRIHRGGKHEKGKLKNESDFLQIRVRERQIIRQNI